MTPIQKTAGKLVGVALVMASLSFAAVPFYNWFCRVTGFAGTPTVAEAAPDTILDQTIRVRFDASTEPGMPWEFKPVVNTMTLRIGENAIAFYEAYNPTDRVVAGTASYNVTPDLRVGISRRSPVSALPSRSCNRESGCRCPSVFSLIPTS